MKNDTLPEMDQPSTPYILRPIPKKPDMRSKAEKDKASEERAKKNRFMVAEDYIKGKTRFER